jgi:hypothetical protein
VEISTGNPTLLRQQDITAPFVAIIADVRVERLTDRRGNADDQYVVYFTAGRPMKFNVINRKTVVAAYGKQREAWIGKPIEIYVDPNVYMGAERTGGIRVRIPAAKPGTPAAPPKQEARPAPRPQGKLPAGTLEHHRTLIDSIDAARSTEYLDKLKAWALGYEFTAAQKEEADEHFQAAIERLATPAAPANGRRLARANGC